MGAPPVACSDVLSMRRGLLLGLLLCFACKPGGTSSETRPTTFDAGAGQTAPVVKEPAEPRLVPTPAVRFDDGGAERKALAAQGALSAWTGVLERYRLLARREETGILVGLLIEQEGMLRLVDESMGMGSLSIPVSLPKNLSLEAPSRVLLWGAWHLDETKNFVWRSTRAETLGPAASPPEFSPGLVARDKKPDGIPVSAGAVSRKGGTIWFQVQQNQGRVGDGWLIFDGSKSPPVARLLLPGERGSYGDQSRVTESERWKLKKGNFYWLDIRRFRPAAEGSLPLFRARTPPFRFQPPAGKSSP